MPSDLARPRRRRGGLLRLVMLCAMGSWLLLLIGSVTLAVQIGMIMLG